MAEKEYEKLLSCLKSNIRGLSYEETTLLSHLKEVDDFISSNCPSFDGVVNKYNKKYVTDNLQIDSQQSIGLSSRPSNFNYKNI